jgi:hypothetical protein
LGLGGSTGRAKRGTEVTWSFLCHHFPTKHHTGSFFSHENPVVSPCQMLSKEKARPGLQWGDRKQEQSGMLRGKWICGEKVIKEAPGYRSLFGKGELTSISFPPLYRLGNWTSERLSQSSIASVQPGSTLGSADPCDLWALACFLEL